MQKQEGANQDIVNAFLEKGGIPAFSQAYTIFAQIYDDESMKVFDKIGEVDVKGDNKHVITSYSIHYTKLYDTSANGAIAPESPGRVSTCAAPTTARCGAGSTRSSASRCSRRSATSSTTSSSARAIAF